MVSILKDIQHLVRYAHWAYMDDDGAEFRSAAQDLEGDVNYRKLKIVTPFFKDFKALTPNTHVHLGVRNGDTLVLAFRGTDFPFTVENLVNPKSWWGFWGNVVTDVAFRMVQIHWLPGDNPAILAHDGFLAAFNNLLKDDRLGSCILQLMGDLPPSKIEVCGHSLGGALATLCALWCRTRWHYANIKCVTLGSPRVGNEAFCQRFHSSAILCYRLEMDGDPIPTVPDRFTQAVPGKLPANDPSWTEGDRTYGHVGIPIILHGAGGRVIYNSVDYDVERPDIEAEKDAPPLPWQFRLPYEFGGFLPYWILRGLKMLPAIWQYHDPTGYETVVQRILERTGETSHAACNGSVPLSQRTPTLTSRHRSPNGWQG
ncbi:Alpha/Beta hydrolase protein [Chaetomium strumarium]|uniref:Alpha/Beta hydrolase protein n=1 Tax=Chaetomium strumarium TaxID=1170767 RepID=A0AAJ0GN47_9PEZI|nr:Alpha/Beta hydrolase protein [Chaetomium strumarium]